VNLFLKLLEKIGRKAIFVDFYGNILMERYFLFYYEEEKAKGWWYWLPNIFIHHFTRNETPDGADPHRHPWSTLTFILNGSYSELINRETKRTNKKYKFGYMSYNDNHRITEGWMFDLDQCVTICRACQELRNGICPKNEETVDFDKHLNRMGSGLRVARWYKADEKSYKLIERRKKALAKLDVEEPETREDKVDILRRQRPRGLIVETIDD
jgi:hypothetical protein